MIEDLQKKLAKMSADHQELARETEKMFNNIPSMLGDIKDEGQRKIMASFLDRVKKAKANSNTDELNSIIKEIKNYIHAS